MPLNLGDFSLLGAFLLSKILVNLATNCLFPQKEGLMKRHLSKVGVMGIIVAFVIISSVSPLAAEKKKFSMSTKMEKLISENYLAVLGILGMFLNKE